MKYLLKAFLTGAGIVLLCTQFTFANPYKKEGASVAIFLDGAAIQDTITLFFWQYMAGLNAAALSMPHIEEKAFMNKDGLFVFKIDLLSGPGYFTFSREIDKELGMPVFILDKYLLENGDRIRIDITKKANKLSAEGFRRSNSSLNQNYADYIFRFSGPGSLKDECRFKADMLADSIRGTDNVFSEDYQYKIALDTSLSVLASCQAGISRTAFAVLKADFTGKYKTETYNSFRAIFRRAALSKDTGQIKNLLESFRPFFSDTVAQADSSLIAISGYYASYIVRKESIIAETENRYFAPEVYRHIKKKYSGVLRDRIITEFFIERFWVDDSLENELSDAIQSVTGEFYIKQLINLKKTQSKGIMAFNFSLPDSNGKIVRMDEFRGKVVFIDFWFTGCGSCQNYYQSVIKKTETYFKGNNAVRFITISIDGKKERWLKSIRSGAYTSGLAHNVVNLYTGGDAEGSPVIQYYHVTGYPRPFLIDKEGKLFSGTASQLDSYANLKSQIEKALISK